MTIGNIGEDVLQKKPEIKIDPFVWLLQTVIWCAVVCFSKIILYWFGVHWSYIFLECTILLLKM